MNLLKQLLAILRAIHWSHWTSHWRVKGDPFYADHLLFQRMYEGVESEIDGLAEKIVGEFGQESIGEYPLMVDAMRFLENHPGDDALINRARVMEGHLQRAIKTTYETLKSNGELSLGMDDFLMALANAHETNLYLLRQRTDGATQKVAAKGDPYWMDARFPGKDTKGRPFKKGDRVFYYPSSKTFLTGPEAEQASKDFEAARFDEGGYMASSHTAGVSHFSAVVQPKSGKPMYSENAVAIPLDWGTTGSMRPYYAAQVLVPLYAKAKNGVAFALDQNGALSKVGLTVLSKELSNALDSHYGEAYAMTTEYFEGNPEGEAEVQQAADIAKAAQDIKVSITPLRSPKTGKSGLKIVFHPSVEELEKIGG